jgi:hypothetical protein
VIAAHGGPAIAEQRSFRSESVSCSQTTVFNGRDETVATAGKGLDISWSVRVVSESGTDLIDQEIDAALEVDEGFVAPDVLVDFFAGDDLTGALCEEQENGKRLRPEPYQVATFAQLTISGIEREGAETN